MFYVFIKKLFAPLSRGVFLSVKEMSKFLNINTSRAYKLIHRQDFPSFKLGNKILIPRNKLFQWINEKREEWLD